jgi:nuclear pore complex protein Nup85
MLTGFIVDDELLITMEDTYELLRHLEEIFIRAEQGSGADYLGALRKMIGDGSDEADALRQLEVVRLTLARYLARCSTKPASIWESY